VLSLSSSEFHQVVEIFKTCKDFTHMLLLNAENFTHLIVDALTRELVEVPSLEDKTDISKIAA